MKYRPKYWNDLMSARIGENNCLDIKKMDSKGIKVEDVLGIMNEDVDNIFFFLYVRSKKVVIASQFEEICLRLIHKHQINKLTKENISEEEIVVLDLIAAFIYWAVIEFNGRDYWGSQEMDNCEIEIYSEKEEN